MGDEVVAHTGRWKERAGGDTGRKESQCLRGIRPVVADHKVEWSHFPFAGS